MKASYDFTSAIDRRKMHSRKWQMMDELNPNVAEGIIPLSVADMEFYPAPEITEGLKQYLDDIVLGYTLPSDAYFTAVTDWFKTEHDWDFPEEAIVLSPNVVSAIKTALLAFTEEGDSALFFSPHYMPFKEAVTGLKREAVTVPLVGDFGAAEIDFEAFEAAAARPEVKVFIHCSPHNPTGRVWTPEEQERLLTICEKHGLFIIADEIWQDFDFTGHHINMAKVSDGRVPVITCTSASKTFNLAGLNCANTVILEDNWRERFAETAIHYGIAAGNVLGMRGVELAYTKAKPWLTEVKELLRHNEQMLVDFIEEQDLPIKAYVPEGTYVQWLDFSDCPIKGEALPSCLYEKASFFSQGETDFGLEEGDFQRVNIALPTESLKKCLERLAEALK